MSKNNSTEIETVTGTAEGIGFTVEQKKNYTDLCTSIEKEISKVEKAYITVAVQIYNIYTGRLYQIDNYANIYEMAYGKFGLSRTNCCNYINICRKFGKIDKTTNRCTGLLPEYKAYAPSKLVAMLDMPDQLLKEIKPDMSVREIRRKKQFVKKMQALTVQEEETAENAQEEETVESTQKNSSVKSAKKQKRELLRAENLDEILNAENTSIFEKLEAFEKEYPDVKYSFSIILEYEE